MSDRLRARQLEMYRANIDRFAVLIAQTESFAALAGLPSDRTLIVPNGTDAERFHAGPLPADPVVALVSGANPGRGIEALIAAVRAVRAQIPSVRLLLGLSATSGGSAAYLAALRESSHRDPWIEIRSLLYAEVPAFLEAASIVAVPHPPGDYMDAVLPVKLADAMASGRPVVATPRRETAALLRHHDAGAIAAGDRVDDLADAIVRLIADPARAAHLGRNAREVAMTHLAWARLSHRVTEHVVALD